MAHVDLFIDHVARNATLQVFVYDNSFRRICQLESVDFFFCFRFSPHSKAVRTSLEKILAGAMSHLDFTCEWNILFSCLHALSFIERGNIKFLLRKILGIK